MTTPALPTYLHTIADLGAMVAVGTTTEGRYLDFKKTIDSWNAPKGAPAKVKQAAQKELCRDVTQFANTDGGCLLIGVDEVKNDQGLKVATKFEAIAEADKMREWIEQAVTNYCVPSTFTHDVAIIQHGDGPTVAVNIQPSVHTVFVYDRAAGTMEVIGRTSHGKKHLNPDELERHMMKGSRAARLRFEEARKLATGGPEVVLEGGVWCRELIKPAWRWGLVKTGAVQLGAANEHCFQLRVPLELGRAQIQALMVPYDLLRSAWVDSARQLHVLVANMAHVSGRPCRGHHRHRFVYSTDRDRLGSVRVARHVPRAPQDHPRQCYRFAVQRVDGAPALRGVSFRHRSALLAPRQRYQVPRRLHQVCQCTQHPASHNDAHTRRGRTPTANGDRMGPSVESAPTTSSS